MTVKELIEKLKTFDENMEVYASTDDGTVDLDLDDAVIKTETWTAEDGKQFDALGINFN